MARLGINASKACFRNCTLITTYVLIVIKTSLILGVSSTQSPGLKSIPFNQFQFPFQFILFNSNSIFFNSNSISFKSIFFQFQLHHSIPISAPIHNTKVNHYFTINVYTGGGIFHKSSYGFLSLPVKILLQPKQHISRHLSKIAFNIIHTSKNCHNFLFLPNKKNLNSRSNSEYSRTIEI